MKKIIVFFLALLLIVCDISVPVSAKSDRLANYDHIVVDFNSLEYKHIDAQEIEDKIERLGNIYSDENNIDEVRELVEWLEENLVKLFTMTYLANYNFFNNPSSEYWNEERQYSSAALEKNENLYIEVLKKIILSPCKASLDDIYTEDFMKVMLGMETATNEDIELSENSIKLYSEYLRLLEEGCEVEYQGKKYSIIELMADYEAGIITYDIYNIVARKILSETELAIVDVYLQMIENNNSMAKKQGFDNYLEYSYRYIFDRDFSPKEAMTICENIRSILEPYGPYFNEYESLWLSDKASQYLEDGIDAVLGRCMEKMGPEYLESFDYMKETNGLQMVHNNGTGNSYTSYFFEYNMPYICLYEDEEELQNMTSLLHEFGHYNAFYWSVPGALFYQSMDFQELFSQGMELLSTHYYKDIYNEAGESAENWLLGLILNKLYYDCCKTEWEYAAYTGKYKNAEELLDSINKIGKKYYSISPQWYLIDQLFHLPGYVFSYPISAMSALELYELSRDDFEMANEKYFTLLADQEKPFKEALSEAGLTPEWTKKEIKKLLNRILEQYIDKEIPVFDGIEDGGYYTDVVSVEIKDIAGLKNISLSNNEVSEKLNTRYFEVGGAVGEYTITATDTFGNTAEAAFEVVPRPFTVTVTGGKKGVQALTWNKVANATYYKIYGAPLGEKFELLGTVDSSDRRFVNKKAGKKVWKYYVAACTEYEDREYDLLKSYRSFGVSLKSKKYTNAVSIEINEGETLELEKGQTKTISITETLGDENKKQFTSKKIKTVKYVSSNKDVADVSKKGKITAVSEGKCMIYAISENGLADMIKVKVG